ncbi:hypothetical protein [Pontibacter amylolyticus]|uniref:PH domain-containing protein n=1 Tax=Pontibacter amylolyticus TaxID=1424080 RepID=A0ABQ1WJG1_9BACT|nr:hypothetical protein [Pontibacter amylolyticus]GGG30670.1 hypothetical protein GCM10011323_37660 [Pontibacter amylolyticus]
MLKKTRITYNWKTDTIYTLFWSFVFVTFFVWALQLIDLIRIPVNEFLFGIYGFVLPVISFFIGLRPVLSLFTVPDTLFINEKGQLITSDSEIIKIEDIQTLEINQVGAGSGHLVYYELTLNKAPNVLKKKKRNSLILTEPYSIKYIFQTRTDLISQITELGVEVNKIKNKPYNTRYFFGIRDKFK